MQKIIRKLLKMLFGWFWGLTFQVNFDMDIRFSDVIGCDGQKFELFQAISRIRKREKNKPKGILICGPEGTGKTLIAKAFIGEARKPYMIISGGEIERAIDIKMIFSVARTKKSCIIFFDEFDALCKNDEVEEILAQLNFEMNQKDNVLVIATTRKENIERSIKRRGRFDIKIRMYFPDFSDRKSIIENWCLENQINVEETSDMIAKKLVGKSFLEIIHIMDVAKDIAQRRYHQKIITRDFTMAIMLEENGAIVKKENSLEDDRITAFHEAGHALLAFGAKTERIREITVIKFANSNGHVTTYPIFENSKVTKEEMECKIMIALAGKASEEVFFGTSSTGARSDLNKAEKLVRKYLTEYCFDSELGIIPISTISSSLQAGTDLNNEVFNRARQLLNNFYQDTKKIIIDQKDLVTEIAEELLRSEVIDEREAYKIYNKYNPK